MLAAGDTVSGFVLRAATEAAADILADRRTFVLDEQAWQVFDQALSRPPAMCRACASCFLRPRCSTRVLLSHAAPRTDGDRAV
jgi:uncharacterized protein (DUF1778 family)